VSIVRVAVVQDAPVVFDREATIEKVKGLAVQAAGQDARLVLFPEAFVSAYPKGLDFGSRIGSRTAAGREDFRRYYDSAVDVPGPATEALGMAAKEGACTSSSASLSGTGGRCTARCCSLLPTAPSWANTAN
jgi:nitrilase